MLSDFDEIIKPNEPSGRINACEIYIEAILEI